MVESPFFLASEPEGRQDAKQSLRIENHLPQQDQLIIFWIHQLSDTGTAARKSRACGVLIRTCPGRVGGCHTAPAPRPLIAGSQRCVPKSELTREIGRLQRPAGYRHQLKAQSDRDRRGVLMRHLLARAGALPGLPFAGGVPGFHETGHGETCDVNSVSGV